MIFAAFFSSPEAERQKGGQNAYIEKGQRTGRTSLYCGLYAYLRCQWLRCCMRRDLYLIFCMVSAAVLVWFLPGWAALLPSSRCWMAAMHRRQLRRLWRCCYAHLQHRCCYHWREVPWLSLHQRYLLGYSENRIWRWTAVGCTAVFLFQIVFKKS